MIRYVLNGMEIDRNKNAGITRTLKQLCNSIVQQKCDFVEIFAECWEEQTTAAGYFNFCVPL